MSSRHGKFITLENNTQALVFTDGRGITHQIPVFCLDAIAAEPEKAGQQISSYLDRRCSLDNCKTGQFIDKTGSVTEVNIFDDEL
jgi:hypothetical protein